MLLISYREVHLVAVVDFIFLFIRTSWETVLVRNKAIGTPFYYFTMSTTIWDYAKNTECVNSSVSRFGKKVFVEVPLAIFFLQL